jgi:hypothetical protein
VVNQDLFHYLHIGSKWNYEWKRNLLMLNLTLAYNTVLQPIVSFGLLYGLPPSMSVFDLVTPSSYVPISARGKVLQLQKKSEE